MDQNLIKSIELMISELPYDSEIQNPLQAAMY